MANSICFFELGLLLELPFSVVASRFFGNLIIATLFEFSFSIKGIGMTSMVVLIYSDSASYLLPKL
ncbi:MAG: hypothetical protein KAH20_02455 [Methylococcales bacterium]|nr:hypothetical protein [Methylococcales bacterium]